MAFANSDNLFYDELRKRPAPHPGYLSRSIMNDEEDSPTRDIADPAAGPDDMVHRKDIREMVAVAISELPKQFRTAIILREIQDLPLTKSPHYKHRSGHGEVANRSRQSQNPNKTAPHYSLKMIENVCLIERGSCKQ